MSDAVRYLSDEWLHEADQHLRALTPVNASVAVAINVAAGPEGPRGYKLLLGPDRVGVEPGTDGGGVIMNLEWDVAVAIAQGRMSAQRAFLDGRLQLGGDTSLLLGHQQELSDIEDKLAALRARTVY